jgi:hypothetical protein
MRVTGLPETGTCRNGAANGAANGAEKRMIVGAAAGMLPARRSR